MSKVIIFVFILVIISRICCAVQNWLTWNFMSERQHLHEYMHTCIQAKTKCREKYYSMRSRYSIEICKQAMQYAAISISEPTQRWMRKSQLYFLRPWRICRDCATLNSFTLASEFPVTENVPFVCAIGWQTYSYTHAFTHTHANTDTRIIWNDGAIKCLCKYNATVCLCVRYFTLIINAAIPFFQEFAQCGCLMPF